MSGKPKTSGEQRAYDFGYLFGIGFGKKYHAFFAKKRYLLRDEIIEKSGEASRQIYRMMKKIIGPALATIAYEENESSAKEQDAIAVWFWKGAQNGFDQGAGILGKY